MAKGSGSAGRGGGGGGGNSAASSGPALAEMTLADFGSAVTDAAIKAVPDVGGYLTFINRAYAQLRLDGQEMSYSDFTAKLLAANRAGTVRLSRADMGYAFNRRNVEGSEVRVDNSTFHFIRVAR
jgi:hypothetical protein